jgi:hypothetical protein
MAKVSKETAQVEDPGPVLVHEQEVEGYVCDFLHFRQDIDMTPLLHGLPGDRCQCPHWGYVIKGQMTFRYADHEETIRAGEAFYAPPGHAPVGNAPGTEYVQWSPAVELAPVSEAIQRNLAAMQPAG